MKIISAIFGVWCLIIFSAAPAYSDPTPDSAPSSPSLAVPNPSGTGPSNFTARDVGNNHDVQLQWQDNSTNELAFLVQRQRFNVDATSWVDLTQLTYNPNVTSATDNVQNGTYRYRIAARFANNQSNWSGWQSVSVANGWTNLSPSADSLVIYVSNSTGNDGNDGLSESNPVRTLSRALTLVRDQMPDWIRLKSGDVFLNERIVTSKSGRSAAEPMVITSYGVGARPRITPASGQGAIQLNYVGNVQNAGKVSLVGLHLDAGDAGDAATGLTIFTSVNTASHFLIEDCVIERFKDNVLMQGRLGGSGMIANVTLRRSVIANSALYGQTNSHGMYLHAIDGLLIEENLIDHNGWSEPDRSDANIFSNNILITTASSPLTTIRRNIIARGSSHGVQLRSGGVIEDNLFLSNPTGILLGGGQPDQNTHRTGVTGSVRGNAILYGLNLNQANLRGVGLQASNIGLNGAVIENNIIAHNVATDALGATGLLFSATGLGTGVGYNNMQVRSNIIYDWRGPLVFIGPSATPPSPSKFNSVTGNIVQDNQVQLFAHDGAVSQIINAAFPTQVENIAFISNDYWSAINPKYAFRYDVYDMNFMQWKKASGDLDSRIFHMNYVDPNRSIDSYNSIASSTPSMDAFLLSARQQRKGSWNYLYTAQNVLPYIRNGFNLVD